MNLPGLSIIQAKKTLRLCLRDPTNKCFKCGELIEVNARYYNIPGVLAVDVCLHEECYFKLCQEHRPLPGHDLQWRGYHLSWNDRDGAWGGAYITHQQEKRFFVRFDAEKNSFDALIGVRGLEGQGFGDLPGIALDEAMNKLKYEALAACAAVLTV